MFILNEKTYWPYTITTMLQPYELNSFAEQLNELKEDDDRITPMENFSCKTIDITIKITTDVAAQFMSRCYIARQHSGNIQLVTLIM